MPCPKCGGEESEPRATLTYERECLDCFWTGPEDAFEPDPEPLWSWHIVEHAGYVWQVVQVKHYPRTLDIESLAIKVARGEAEEIVDSMRATAPSLGRRLRYD